MPEVDLQPHAVRVVHDRLDDGIFDAAARQAHDQAVADLELALWLFAGHGEERYTAPRRAFKLAVRYRPFCSNDENRIALLWYLLSELLMLFYYPFGG